jgi:hypothetical protein
MIPTINYQQYPVFMPDQVLTSQNLNDLFNYQDEQERMTRANLIGIGIVCGLEVRKDSDNAHIVISKGTGITSEGYLVTIKETSYHRYAAFDAAKPRYYAPFLQTINNSGGTKQINKFDMWELKELSEAENTDLLTAIPGGLSDKVVLLFVELLENSNKNCDPNSCDDKGVNVQVNIRPLLVRTADAATLIKAADLEKSPFNYNHLVALRMPRWDVPSTNPVTSTHILNAYRKVLSPAFVQSVETALTKAYQQFKPIIQYEQATDPFASISENFAFLQLPLSKENVLHIQYYYDFFSDLLQAYDEFCQAGKALMRACCPDQTLFPRHLLLGEAKPLTTDTPSIYRHYFTYSPLFECKDLVFNLRTLFYRMKLMVQAFERPAIAVANSANNDDNIRITPSGLGSMPLSDKAIPYYYRVNNNTFPLHQFWSADKRQRDHADEVLSYHASAYSNLPFIKTPLLYDLEPHNFLRIEGIVGKPIHNVLNTIKKRIDDNRLPIQVLALKTGDVNTSGFTPDEMDCDTKDLELSYDIVRREWEAVVGKTIEYIDDVMSRVQEWLGTSIVTKLTQYKTILHVSKTYMVDDLPTFISSYDSFMPVFEKVEADATSLAKALRNMLEDAQQMELSIEAQQLLEDLIDHLDEVVQSCQKGPFRAIQQEYQKRVVDIAAKQYFGNYIKSHPGVQHKAGAPLGGTFILVYHTVPAFVPLQLSQAQLLKVKQGSFVVKGKVTNTLGQPLLNAVIAEQNTGATAQSTLNGNFTITLKQIPTVVSVKAAGHKLEQQIITNALAEVVFKLEEEPLVSPQLGYESVADGTVIADFFLPYTCCSDCAPIQFAIQEPLANMPPIARAGEDVSIRQPISQVVLDGSYSTDPEKRLKSYAWTQVSGPVNTTIADPTGALTNVSGLTQLGDYIFSLTVTDYDGLSHTDEVRVTILEALNIPPTVNAGADQTIQLPATLTLMGTAADADGPMPVVQWSVKPGSPLGATFTAVNNTTTQVNGLVAGTYFFVLTATDSRNESRSDEVRVIVQPPNQAPQVTATASTTQVTLPPGVGGSGTTNIQLIGTANDPDGNNPLTLAWTMVSGTTGGASLQTPVNTLNCTVILSLPGVYTFRLTATDAKGLSGNAQITVTVVAANQLPNVNPVASPAVHVLPIVGGSATSQLAANASDPDAGDTITVAWSIFSGPTGGATIPVNNTANTSVNFTQPGTYVIRATVTDNRGGVKVGQTTVTVTRTVNQPPSLVVKATPNPVTMDQNYMANVILDSAGSSDPEGTIATYNWALTGGGLPHQLEIFDPTKPSSKVLFLANDDFEFTLTATDNNGLAASKTVKVTVNPPSAATGQKTCASLDAIINEYITSIANNDTPAGNKFRQDYKLVYPDVEALYRDMVVQKIASLSITRQIDYFAQQEIAFKLRAWTDELVKVISQISTDPAELAIALKMLELHARLTYYIACIQTTDIDAANTKVKMAESLKGILEASNQLAKEFTGARAALLTPLSDATKDARGRSSNTFLTKPNHTQALVEIIIALMR